MYKPKKTRPAVCICGEKFMAKQKSGNFYTEYCSLRCANRRSGFMSYGRTKENL